ncbi:putative Phenylacetic acid degradation-related protein [uncultured delta proteobacterium]|uniref:Putative Phenylacetic acid degradation-related protein n=1 Tax=uncultured delta proteobacterium TaxID=34034 RepID=A0A212JTP2_9DELT|nr:putative Phenylacetic acid degradation-related protein [uncultured delta proteobacterium]
MTTNPYLQAMTCEIQSVNPLFNLLGARLVSAAKGEARIELPISPCLTQGEGAVAGGILATLADEAMAHAVISLLDHDKHTVTTEMNIRFLRATDPNRPGTLIGTAEVVKAGRSILSVEARVTDDTGKLLATAGGSFFVVDAKRAAS